MAQLAIHRKLILEHLWLVSSVESTNAFHRLIGYLLRQDFTNILAEKVLRRVEQHRSVARVVVEVYAIVVKQEHHVRNSAQNSLILFVAFSQLLFSSFALSEVGRDPKHA